MNLTNRNFATVVTAVTVQRGLSGARRPDVSGGASGVWLCYFLDRLNEWQVLVSIQKAPYSEY